MKRALSAICVISLSACGIVSLVPKESLSPTDGPSLFLPAPFSFVPQTGATSGMTLTLAPGEYRPVLKDNDGVFLRGPDWCVGQSFGKGSGLRHGGVWLPNAGTALRPRVFVYDGLSKDATTDPLTPQNTTSIGLQATPAQASPIAVGVGAGIGYGIVSALARIDPTGVLFITGQIQSSVTIESALKPQVPAAAAR